MALTSCNEDVVTPNEQSPEVATPDEQVVEGVTAPDELGEDIATEVVGTDENAKYTSVNSFNNTLNLDESFLSILNEKKLFNLNASQKEISIEEFVFPCYVNDFSKKDNLFYANVDMDDNGVDELVIKDNCGDKLILSILGENVVGYSFSFRNIDKIYTDGSFSWNYTDYRGLHYGVSKLSFLENNYSVQNIYSISECTENHGDELYYIGENLVSENDYYAYVEQFSDEEIDFCVLKTSQ